MFVLGDTSGSALGLSAPLPPMELPMPIMNKIVMHPGESGSSYSFLCAMINKLMHATNFMPDYMNKLYAGQEVTEADLTQFGQAYTDPQEASNFAFDGDDPWHGAAGRGFGDESFGYAHPISYFGRYWGDGLGAAGSENLNWNPAAYQDNYFKEDRSYDTEDVDDPELYAATTGISADELGDYSDYIDDAKAYLEGSYGNKSFYEIVMSGINGTNIAYYNDSGGGKGIDLDATTWGNYDYIGQESWGGDENYGAFLFMTSIVRARRMIYSAMSELFGPHSWIVNAGDINGIGPNNEDMISQFENVMQNSLGGAHENNKAFLYVFFAMQHYLHAILPAYSGGYDSDVGGYGIGGKVGAGDDADMGHGGFCGWMRDSRDMVAFAKFRDWIRNKADDYIDSLDGDAKSNADKIRHEFKYNFSQPYGYSGGSFTGWDYYYPTTSLDNSDDPYYNTLDNQHPNYALSQLCRLGDSQIRGRKLFTNGVGDSVNIFGGNSTVHFVGRFLNYQAKANAEPALVMAMNWSQRNRNRVKTREWHDKVKEKKQEKREQQIEDAQAEAKRASRLRALKKAGLRRKPATGGAPKSSNKMRVEKSNKQSLQTNRPANQTQSANKPKNANQPQASKKRKDNKA